MALTAVVNDALIEGTIRYLRKLEGRHGDLGFAMLQRNAGGNEGWELTIAAPWLDRVSKLTATGEIIRDLREELGADAPKFRGALVRGMHSPVVRTLAPQFSVMQLGTAYAIINSLELTYLDIDEAVLLLSRPELIDIPVAA